MESLKSPLFALVGVQTILVAALFFKTTDLEKRLDTAPAMAPSRQMDDPAPVAAPGLSESAVRAILREELAALPRARDDGMQTPPTAAPARTAATDRAFLDVQQETRRLIAKGAATEAELADLEMQIAELPPDQRRQALSALSRAVSNGTLDARF